MSSLQSTTPPDATEGGLVSAATLATQLANNPDNLVVDVRTPGEFASGHIRSAINLPLDQVDAHLRRIVTDAGGRLVLVCQSGGRATQAYDKLTAAGLDDVEVLDGGMNAWIAAGAETDVSDDPDQWTMERQVRLVAGGIVATSVAASTIWSPAKYLAGAVGAGLTYAALSNTCAMGMLLARLPYNRAPETDIDEALARLTGSSRR